MSINSIETATAYSGELDKLFVNKSVTGFFTDNVFGARFVGAKTVVLPNIDFQGLNNYDRDTGFNRGAVTVSNTSYTMQMDRARSLQIDREDLDETGIASLAGKVLGEYVRTKVVPECDAYVLSKLAAAAVENDNVEDEDFGNIYAKFNNMVAAVRKKVGFEEELVAFVNSDAMAAMQNNPEFVRALTVSDFKKGEINTTVKSINSVAIIPTRDDLLYSQFAFLNDAEGGFKPGSDCLKVSMLICPKRCAYLVKKSEQLRVFSPEQNVGADAYKFDYRIYYDMFIRKGYENTVAIMGIPFFEYELYGINETIYEGTSTDLSIEITDPKVSSECEFQWYTCDENGKNTEILDDINATSHRINVNSSNYVFGKNYYLCEMTYQGHSLKTPVFTVTVTK